MFLKVQIWHDFYGCYNLSIIMDLEATPHQPPYPKNLPHETLAIFGVFLSFCWKFWCSFMHLKKKGLSGGALLELEFLDQDLSSSLQASGGKKFLP